MMPILALALLSPSPVTFRPSVSIDDAVSGVQMCRAVVTPTGFDERPLKSQHWPALKITATTDEERANLGTIHAWSPPNGSFLMLMVSTKNGKVNCNVAAPVSSRETGEALVAKLPVHLTPSDKAGQFDASDNGQKIHVSMGDNVDNPTINISVTRPVESK